MKTLITVIKGYQNRLFYVIKSPGHKKTGLSQSKRSITGILQSMNMRVELFRGAGNVRTDLFLNVVIDKNRQYISLSRLDVKGGKNGQCQNQQTS